MDVIAALFRVLSWQLPVVNEENQENFSQDGQFSGKIWAQDLLNTNQDHSTKMSGV
jgi:hypothetical protein